MKNHNGQLLIEVLGASVVAALVLTAAAAALMGHWKSMARVKETIVDGTTNEGKFKTVFMEGCGTSTQLAAGCASTSDKDIAIKESILIYAPVT